MADDIHHRLSTWRSLAASGNTAQVFPGTAGLAEAHHWQQVQRSSAFCLRTLRRMRRLPGQF
jgi:hypothetical protein